LFTALVATGVSFYFLLDPNSHPAITIILTFVASVVFWATTCHVFAMNFGVWLTQKLSRWPVLSANLVRAIDYVYLTISTFSILRIVVSAVSVGNGVTYFNATAAVMLGLAVAVRLTRTSIEIFGWDKPRGPVVAGRAGAG
jgi:hypothetical protein